MLDIFVPLLIGFFIALAVVVAIRALRARTSHQRPPIVEEPLSRQHRRAMERRTSKRR